MAKIKLLFFTFLIAGIFGVVECNQQLEDFVRLKMANFSTWLKTNNLDPSELQNTINPQHLSVNDTYAKIDWEIMSHQVSGFSERLEIGSIYGRLTEEEKYFHVQWTTGAVSFFGEYKANGTVGSQNVPFSGAGRWHINVPFLQHTFNYVHFNETQSGYLRITSLDIRGILLNFENDGIDFEHLFEGEAASWAPFIKNQMFMSFENYINTEPENPGNPLRMSYVKYWEQTLSETTMADIMGPGNNP